MAYDDDLAMVEEMAGSNRQWGVDYGGSIARVLLRAVGTLDVMAGQGTPTPVEPTRPSAEKDTLMERSIDKDQEKHTTQGLKNFLSSDHSLANIDILGDEDDRKEEDSPRSPENFSEYLRSPEFLSGAGDNRSGGTYTWVTVADFEDAALEKNSAKPAPTWDPDNGPDGAFGPDVVKDPNPATVRLWKDVCAAADAHWMAGKDARFTLAVREIVLGALGRSGLL